MSDKNYRTIKALVFDFVHSNGGNVKYEELTQEVMKYFPSSKWKKSHWAWYRYQILNGRFKRFFSETELAALSHTKGPKGVVVSPVSEEKNEVIELAKGPRAKDAEVKRIGDALLNHVRQMISLIVGTDLNKHFKLNRWIFSRLLQDEIRVKRPVKQLLWKQGMRSCRACGETFDSLKGVEIHRKNESLGYTVDNCEFLCRECHQELDRTSNGGQAAE